MCTTTTTCAFTTATSSQVAVVRDATSAANPSKAASSSAHSLSEQPINANFLFLFLRLLVVFVKQDPKMLRSVYLCKNFPRRRGHYFCGKKRQDTGRYLGVCKVLFTALESNRFNFSENLIVDFLFLILQCFHSALLSLFENK